MILTFFKKTASLQSVSSLTIKRISLFFKGTRNCLKYFKIKTKNIINNILNNLYVAGGSGDVLHRGDVRYSSLNYKSLPAGGEQRTRLDSTSSGTDSSSRVFKISKVLGGMYTAQCAFIHL